MTSGVLVLDKPRGLTSHDVVARIRRAIGVRRVGHAGTLDPMATGVLVVAVGEATKLVPWLTCQDKTYEATIALGIETDTLDAEGLEARRAPVSDDLRLALRDSCRASVAPVLQAALDAETARIYQIPPAISAIRQSGERAYARARRGLHPVLRARPVQAKRLALTASGDEPAFVAVELDVTKGYYVRALARDLAGALGTVGHLTSLRRMRSGCFLCAEALSPDASPDELRAGMYPVSRAATHVLPIAELTDLGAQNASHGRSVRPQDIHAPAGGPSAWLDRKGDLIAIGRIDESGCGRVLRGFAAG